MKTTIGSLIDKVLTRKFGIAVAGIVVLMSHGLYADAGKLATAYLAAEGIGDAAGRFKSNSNSSPSGVA